MASQRLNQLVHTLRSVRDLHGRISALEAEVQECRQLNLRLAELTDVMMEMLLPVADRDEKAVAAILERYRKDVGEPIGWRNG